MIHEANKRLVLIRQMEDKKQYEMLTKPQPRINEKSKRLASSKERKGKIHERLHRDGRKKKPKYSQDLINDISSVDDERSSSCPRKGVQNILNDEAKELTFKPEIDK